MKLNNQKLSQLKAGFDAALARILPFLGLPLVMMGVILLAIHFFCHLTANWLMVVALIMELAGAWGHFRKLSVHNQK